MPKCSEEVVIDGGLKKLIDMQELCERFSDKEIDEGSIDLSLIDDRVYTIGEKGPSKSSMKSPFNCCESLLSVDLSGVSALRTLGCGTFTKCFFLESIIFPESLDLIDEYAFQQCKALNNVTIPDRVRKISKGAFMRCFSLTDIKFNDQLHIIDVQAFCKCTSLKKVVPPRACTHWVGGLSWNAPHW